MSEGSAKAVAEIVAIDLDKDGEVRSALRRLMAARNGLVHPTAFVGGPTDDQPPMDPPMGIAEAQRAYEDMQLVLGFLASKDERLGDLLI